MLPLHRQRKFKAAKKISGKKKGDSQIVKRRRRHGAARYGFSGLPQLSNTLRLGFYYLKIIDILHTRYHARIIGHVLKNKQKKKCACVHEIIRLIIMKAKMKMKKDDIDTT